MTKEDTQELMPDEVWIEKLTPSANRDRYFVHTNPCDENETKYIREDLHIPRHTPDIDKSFDALLSITSLAKANISHDEKLYKKVIGWFLEIKQTLEKLKGGK